MSFGTTAGYATEGGEFTDVPDDVYLAKIIEVSDPFPDKDPTTGKARTQVKVIWEFLPRPDQVEAGCPETEYTRTMWITLPDAFLDHGAIGKKSKLFALLETLGYDMNAPLAFTSDDWIGMKARVVITHNASGYPNITKLMPAPAKARPTARPAATVAGAPAKRAPVGATPAARPTRPAYQDAAKLDAEEWADEE